MTGVMLVNQDMVAAIDGKIIKGPKEDKIWLASFVKNKVAIVGSRTYEADLINMSKFIASMKELIVIGKDYVALEDVDLSKVDICLGGPTLLDSVNPEILILHQIYEDRISMESCKLVLGTAGYTYESIKEFDKYSEIILRRKNAK